MGTNLYKITEYLVVVRIEVVVRLFTQSKKILILLGISFRTVNIMLRIQCYYSHYNPSM
jgi:hypothetical protein